MATVTLLKTGVNMSGVELIKLVTKEITPRTILYTTMTNMDAKAKISEGDEKTQRIKNTVMGRIKTDDILEGYDIEAEDERVIMEVLTLVDGGTYDNANSKYSAPVIGEEVKRTAFDMYVYTGNRNAAGEIDNYLEWYYPNCKGKPIDLSVKDGDFSKQKYTIQSRANDGESPFEVGIVDELPATTEESGSY